MKRFGLVESAICLLVVTAALGEHFLPLKAGGVEVFGFRLLVPLVLSLLVVSGKGVLLNFGALSRWYFHLGVFWITWGLFALIWSSLIWGSSVPSGLIELSAVGLGFLTAVALLNLAFQTRYALNALRAGWVWAFVITLAIAAWEFSAGKHLPGYPEDLDVETVWFRVFSTFGNPNNYAAFLCLCFPFLVWSFRAATGARKTFYLLLSLAAPVALLCTMGRLALFGIVFECIVLLMLTVPRIWSTAVAATLVAGLATMVIAPGYSGNELKFFTLYDEFAGGGSATMRLNLLRDGMVFLERSNGAGVGPANFPHMMRIGQGPYPAEWIVYPHNFWMEVASQYGLPVFLLLMGWLIFATSRSWKVRAGAIARGDDNARYAAEAMLLGLVGYVFAAGENSSYIPQQTNWMFLASVLTVVCLISGDRPDFLRVRQRTIPPLRTLRTTSTD